MMVDELQEPLWMLGPNLSPDMPSYKEPFRGVNISPPVLRLIENDRVFDFKQLSSVILLFRAQHLLKYFDDLFEKEARETAPSVGMENIKDGADHAEFGFSGGSKSPITSPNDLSQLNPQTSKPQQSYSNGGSKIEEIGQKDTAVIEGSATVGTLESGQAQSLPSQEDQAQEYKKREFTPSVSPQFQQTSSCSGDRRPQAKRIMDPVLLYIKTSMKSALSDMVTLYAQFFESCRCFTTLDRLLHLVFEDLQLPVKLFVVNMLFGIIIAIKKHLFFLPVNTMLELESMFSKYMVKLLNNRQRPSLPRHQKLTLLKVYVSWITCKEYFDVLFHDTLVKRNFIMEDLDAGVPQGPSHGRERAAAHPDTFTTVFQLVLEEQDKGSRISSDRIQRSYQAVFRVYTPRKFRQTCIR